MKHLSIYTYSCTNAIFEFLKDLDSKKLISKLRNIELHAKDSISNSDEKTLWFKFGNDDTLSTDIKDIEFELLLPSSHENNKRLINLFEMVTKDIEPSHEIRVFFS
jgi:hypothetical protein